MMNPFDRPVVTAEHKKEQRRGYLLVAAGVAVGVLWLAGVFDTELARFGLNHGTCYRNLVTGAYFCGGEGRQVHERQLELQKLLNR